MGDRSETKLPAPTPSTDLPATIRGDATAESSFLNKSTSLSLLKSTGNVTNTKEASGAVLGSKLFWSGSPNYFGATLRFGLLITNYCAMM